MRVRSRRSLLLLQQLQQGLRAAPVQVGLDVGQGHSQLLEDGNDLEHLDLRGSIVAVTVLPPDGGREDAGLIVVKQGVLGDAAQGRKFPGGKAHLCLIHGANLPLDYRVTR